MIMKKHDLVRLILIITGEHLKLDVLRERWDFSFYANCRTQDVDAAAQLLRRNSYSIEERLHSIMNLGFDYVSHWRTGLPYFVCLERERSLIIPRPHIVTPKRFWSTISRYTGSLLSTPKRRAG